MKKYRVCLGVTGYIEYTVEAESEGEAAEQAEEMYIDRDVPGFGFGSNFARWEDADTIECEDD